jgi:hypothetical protein
MIDSQVSGRRHGRARVSRRSAMAARYRPQCEGLEERTVLSSGMMTAAIEHMEAVHRLELTAHVGRSIGPVAPRGALFERGAGLRVERARMLLAGRRLGLEQRLLRLEAAQHRLMPHAAPVSVAPQTSVAAPPTAATATTTAHASTADPTLVTLDLKPLDVHLLGLQVQTSEITVTVSAQPGSGELLGNLLTDVSGLVNLPSVNNALNKVLSNVVTLVNSASLQVSGVSSSGPLGSSQTQTTTPVLSLHVAPVHLNLLGAVVTTSPINVSITAHSGQGKVLGNVLTDLADLLNGQPQNAKLNIDSINSDLEKLLSELNTAIPGINAATSTTVASPAATAATTSTENILRLKVPPIDLNLLGLVLQTNQIQVNADAHTGDGNLLGNLLNQVLNTLGATPAKLATLNTDLNALLGKVVAVLNATTLVLPAGAVGSLGSALQTLALPNLVNTTGTSASAPVLNLDIAALPNATLPPVDVNVLGLTVTTSDIHAQLTARTGEGQILGNLVYNVSHLLDPGGSVGLLGILGQLGL